MIIKMSASCIINNFESGILYHEKKVEKGVAILVDGSGNLTHNAKNKAVDFDYTNSLNPKLRVKGFDIPFSFSKEDQVSERKMLQILHDFKKDMGFEERPYLLYKHEDTDNLHYHLVVSNTDWKGKTNDNIRGFYRREATLLARKYELEYGLKQLSEINPNKSFVSSVEKNKELYTTQRALKKAISKGLINDSFVASATKKLLKNNEIKDFLGNKYSMVMDIIYQNDLIKKSDKSKLIEKIQPFLEKHSRAEGKNLDSFFLELEQNNIYVRELKKTNPRRITYGIDIDGNMFYCSSKSLPERFSYQALLNNKSTNYTVDQQNSFLRNQLGQAYKVSSSYEDFKSKLEERGIKIAELYNEKFGVYGLKYSSIEADDPVVFSASELDRKYSFKKLEDFFENRGVVKAIKISEVTRDKAQVKTEQKIIEKPRNVKKVDNNLDDLIGGEKTKGVTKKAKVGKDFEKKKRGK